MQSDEQILLTSIRDILIYEKEEEQKPIILNRGRNCYQNRISLRMENYAAMRRSVIISGRRK